MHNAATEDEMQSLITSHASKVCALCGEYAAGGGYEQWIANLWRVVRKEQSTAQPGSAVSMVSYEDCAHFIYDLFVRSPLRGVHMEDKALRELNRDVSIFKGRNATPHEDVTFAVDIVFPTVGVQVKPVSFFHQSQRTPRHMESCLERNARWGMPVHYLYYDARLEWVNYEDVKAAVASEAKELLALMDDENG